MAATLNWRVKCSEWANLSLLLVVAFTTLGSLSSDMPDSSRTILPLPSEVAAQIKSSISIPSLTSAVIGLISNSLDAEAHKIDVSVDFSKGAATVEDDGLGISPKEFTEAGGLGKLHRELAERFVHLQSLISSRYLKTRC